MTTFHTAKVEGLDVFYREAGDPTNPKLLLLGGLPVLVAPVPQPDPGAGRALPCPVAGLPGLRQHRHARPGDLGLHLRPPRRDRRRPASRGRLHRPDGDLHAGLRRTDRQPPHRQRTPTGCSGRSSRTPTPTRRASPRPGTASATHSGSTAAPRTRPPLEAFLQPETVKAIYTTGHPDPSKISPDNWNTDLFFLSRPHAHRVQLDLFYDYRTNAALYDTWQASLRERQPLTLIFWGQGDIFFTPAGGEAYLRDLPDAELVRLDSGHFAVEDNLEEIAGRHHPVLRRPRGGRRHRREVADGLSPRRGLGSCPGLRPPAARSRARPHGHLLLRPIVTADGPIARQPTRRTPCPRQTPLNSRRPTPSTRSSTSS